MKNIIKYDIPIQGKEHCEKYNKMNKKMFGDSFTPAKTTGEHIEILLDKLSKEIGKVGDEGGWYIGDGIKVSIEIEYDPEDK